MKNVATPLSAAEQSEVAYREMRRSLVKFAQLEAELLERKLSPTQEDIVVARLTLARERVVMWALVYGVERDRVRCERDNIR